MKLKKLLASVTAATLAMTTLATTSFTPVSAETEEIVSVYKAGDPSSVPELVLWSKEAKAAFTEDVTSFTINVDGEGDGSFDMMDTLRWCFIHGSDKITKEYMNSNNQDFPDAWKIYSEVAAGAKDEYDDETDIQVYLVGYTAVRSVSITFYTDDVSGVSTEAETIALSETEPAVSESESEETAAAPSSEEAAEESEAQEEAAAEDISNALVKAAADPGKTFELYNYQNGGISAAGAGVSWTVVSDRFTSRITNTNELRKCYAEVTFSKGSGNEINIQPNLDYTLAPWEMAEYGEGGNPAKVSLTYATETALENILETGFVIGVKGTDDSIVEEVKFMYDSEVKDELVSLPHRPEGFEYENVIREILPSLNDDEGWGSFPAVFKDRWTSDCTINGKDREGCWSMTQGAPLDESDYSNENVYLRVKFSSIGDLVTDDGNGTELDRIPFDDMIAEAYDFYRWANVIWWFNGSEEDGTFVGCKILPTVDSTSEDAVAYVPISAVKAIDENGEGYLGAGLMCSFFDGVTVEAMDIVEFSDEPPVEDGDDIIGLPARPEGFEYENVIEKIVPVVNDEPASFPAAFREPWEGLCSIDGKEQVYIWAGVGLDSSIYSNENVYLRVKLSGIGALIPDDPNEDPLGYDSSVVYGSDKWAAVMQWCGGDDVTEVICRFRPTKDSTADNAVVYAPISAVKALDIEGTGYIGGGVTNGAFDKLTVEAMDIVEFSNEPGGEIILPEGKKEVTICQLVPAEETGDKYPLTTTEQWGDLTYLKTSKAIDPAILSDSNVFIKLTATNVGKIRTDDGDFKLEDMDNISWVVLAKWYNWDEELEDFSGVLEFTAAAGSTSDSAVSYVPLSWVKGDLFNEEWNILGGNLQGGHADGIEVLSVEIVRFVKSDINNDTFFDIDDVIDLARSILTVTDPAKNPYLPDGDRDGNGIIDIDDVILLARELIM